MSAPGTAARLVVLLGLLAGLGGCGGGSSSGSSGSSGSAGASSGQQGYADANCGSCHTLAAAHSTGVVGPKLDGLRLPVATVEQWVRNGGGQMPKFAGQLTDAQIRAVSEYVVGSARKP